MTSQSVVANLYQNPYLFSTPQLSNSQKRLIDFDYGNDVSKTAVYGTQRAAKRLLLRSQGVENQLPEIPDDGAAL